MRLESLSVVLVLIVSLSGLRAQDADKVAEMQRIYREQAQPGVEHKMLVQMAGSWDLKMTMWPEPGASPSVLAATAESRLILGGRFLQSEFQALGSEDLISVTLLGFDRRSGEFNALGMDVSGTYWVTAKGKASEAGEPIVMSGEDYNPSLDHLQIYDFILEWVDADTFTWSIVFKDDIHTRGGDPFKAVELTYSRRK